MEFIISAIIGIVCVIIGILNIRGNVSMLHSYHTKRVKEEDKVPFGRLVGAGTITIGVGLVIFSIFNYAYYRRISVFISANIAFSALFGKTATNRAYSNISFRA